MFVPHMCTKSVSDLILRVIETLCVAHGSGSFGIKSIQTLGRPYALQLGTCLPNQKTVT